MWREMTVFPPCFHLVKRQEISSHFGLAFSLVYNSVSSDRIFLKSSQKTLLGFIHIMKSNCLIWHMDASPSISDFHPHTPQVCSRSYIRYRLGTPEIIFFPNFNNFSLLEDSSVQLPNRECPWVIKSGGVLHPGGLRGKKKKKVFPTLDPLVFALIFY